MGSGLSDILPNSYLLQSPGSDMPEMIIPGTYIEVRSEGLISAGRVATGIVGVIGTAERGPIGVPVTLGGLTDARNQFGSSDDYDRPDDGSHPLTLVRAMEYIYNNGASTVIGVRVAGASQSVADYALLSGDGQAVATLVANSPGTWGNAIQVETGPAPDDCRVDNEVQESTFSALTYSAVVASGENRIRIFQGVNKRFKTLNIVYKRTIKREQVTRLPASSTYVLANVPIENVEAVNRIVVIDGDGAETEYTGADILYDVAGPPASGQALIDTSNGELTFGDVPDTTDTVLATYAVGHPDPQAGEVLVTTWDGSLQYAIDEAPDQANGDQLVASYLVDRDDCVEVSLTYEAVTESYITPDGRLLSALINEDSAIVTANADDTNGGDAPASGVSAFFGTGSNTPGSNGADAGGDEYGTGLEAISNQLINIVVLAGQDSGAMGSILEGHLNMTEQTDYERIGVIGAPGEKLEDYLGHTVASDRMILVAPGMMLPDGTELPAAYTAAAVAGLISSLDVETSLTNKSLTIPGLGMNANRGQQIQLIKRNILGIVLTNGHRVLKGITTQGEGAPFSSIPTRRIVDYAKYGVRSAANPYIGRLNNSRVRAALQATLEGFLTRMVEDEALTGFELEVSATRAQEIAGEVNVIMTLQPTFSIDFVRVVMNLK